MPEGVDESFGQQLCHLAALLIGESRIPSVCLRVLYVYFLMRHIQVSADDYSFLCGKSGEICPEVIFPAHPVVEPGKFFLRIWRVHAYKIELMKKEG